MATTSTVTGSTATSHAKPLPTFILKLKKSDIVFDGTALNGTYGQLDNGDGPLVGFNGAPKSDAVVLSLNSAGNLVIDQLGIIGYQELLHFESAANAYATGVPAICSVAGDTLTCKAGSNTFLVLCPGEAVTDDLFLVNVVKPGLVAPRLKVIHV